MSTRGRIVIASNNAHKVTELQAMLTRFNLVTQAELGVTDAEETGTTFVENAIIKARHAAAVTGLAAIADDSGLSVPALGGAPGVYSARFAGANATDADNNHKLLAKIARFGDDKLGARFHCVIAFMQSAGDPTPLIAHGTLDGRLVREARGSNGFGYDPHFLVPDQNLTLAEMGADAKNRISHRAGALARLKKML
jgi:XTP/dITP diphosphohydrolase